MLATAVQGGRLAVIRRGTRAVHIETPLILSKPLSHKLKKDVYLKLDCVQPSGTPASRTQTSWLTCFSKVRSNSEGSVAQ
jgi:hypothetical protein